MSSKLIKYDDFQNLISIKKLLQNLKIYGKKFHIPIWIVQFNQLFVVCEIKYIYI